MHIWKGLPKGSMRCVPLLELDQALQFKPMDCPMPQLPWLILSSISRGQYHKIYPHILACSCSVYSLHFTSEGWGGRGHSAPLLAKPHTQLDTTPSKAQIVMCASFFMGINHSSILIVGGELAASICWGPGQKEKRSDETAPNSEPTQRRERLAKQG